MTEIVLEPNGCLMDSPERAVCVYCNWNMPNEMGCLLVNSADACDVVANPDQEFGDKWACYSCIKDMSGEQ